MVVEIEYVAVFWINSLPHYDGVSRTMSPHHIMTGRKMDGKGHIRTEFGDYVQTHEPHRNGMEPRTQGAICLGPTGNDQEGHLSLLTGKVIV